MNNRQRTLHWVMLGVIIAIFSAPPAYSEVVRRDTIDGTHLADVRVPPEFHVNWNDHAPVEPGHILILTIMSDCGLKTANAMPSDVDNGGWGGGLTEPCGFAIYSAMIPDDFAGTHSGRFDGLLCTCGSGGEGEGPGECPPWGGDSVAEVCETRINETGELGVQQSAQANDETLTATTTHEEVQWVIDDALDHVKHTIRGSSVTFKYLPGQGMQDSAKDEIGVTAHGKGHPDCKDERVVEIVNTWRPGEPRRPVTFVEAAERFNSTSRPLGPPLPPGVKRGEDAKVSELIYGPETEDQLNARYRAIGRASGRGSVVARVFPDPRAEGEVIGVGKVAVALMLHIDDHENKIAKAMAAAQSEESELGTVSFGLTIKGVNIGFEKTFTEEDNTRDTASDDTAIAGAHDEEGLHSPGNELKVATPFFVSTKIGKSLPPGWEGFAFALGSIDWDTDQDEIIWSPTY